MRTAVSKLAAMAQVVLAVDVVTGLVGLGATAQAPTVSAQATTPAIRAPGQPMSYNFVNATCYGSGKFMCVRGTLSCLTAQDYTTFTPMIGCRCSV